MATYGDLKKQILRDSRDVTLDSDQLLPDGTTTLTDSTVEYYLKRAIRKLERKGLWFQQEATTLSTTASQRTVALPSDFLKIINLKVTENSYNYTMEQQPYVLVDDLDTQTSFTTRPRFYALLENELVVWPRPQMAFSLLLTYYRSLPELVQDSDSNAWTTTAQDAAIAQAMCDIFTLYKVDDKRAIMYRGILDEELRYLMKQQTARVGSGRILVPYL